ncbi:T9SS type A sorting domain-containing protein [bacterium]|nr:T9SS type A sorting domain-containing protein [bacterium]MBU1881923.1 T9SS type A sorting domain-containing protein [bacterium]
MRKFALLCILGLLFSGVASAQLSGPLSGILGPGSYTVDDSIYVEAGASLTIEPGTQLNFIGALGFGIAGTLTAVGTETDSIYFQPAIGVPFWKGMDFTPSSTANCQLSYCVITQTSTGGIYIDTGAPVITHCTFTFNSSQEMGGAIYSKTGSGLISDCYFGYNSSENGGAVVIRYAPVDVINCVFEGNNAPYGGAMAYYFSTICDLKNCLFLNNSGTQGGAIRFSSSPVNTTNCTYTGNAGSDGSALFIINQNPVAKNIIAWGNTGSDPILLYAGGFTCSYSDVEGGYAGTGNINADPEFTAGTNGNYYLCHTACGQPTTSPCVDTGDPASAMIMGTTRTDEVPDAGVVDMGYHYQVASLYPDVNIELTYVSGPGGGFIVFDLFVENASGAAQDFDAWLATNYNGGSLTTLIMRSFIDYQPGWTINRPRMFYPVGTLPPGEHGFWGLVGSEPGVIWDSSGFTIVVPGLDYVEGFVQAPAVDAPNPFEVIDKGDVAQVGEYALLKAYPNPFNPSTTIQFVMPKAGQLNLAVFDLQGRLVSELVNGYRQAGNHSLSWDASALTSGVYLCRIQTGEVTSTTKLVLMK